MFQEMARKTTEQATFLCRPFFSLLSMPLFKPGPTAWFLGLREKVGYHDLSLHNPISLPISSIP